MRVSRQLLHGLCIDAPLEMGPEAPADAAADLELTIGPSRPVPMDAPAGEVIVALAAGGRPVHTGAGDSQGYVLRVHGLCDFAITGDLRRVECRPDPVASLEQIVLLLRGSVLSFVLGLAGECCLHASAVQMPDSDDVVAFVGGSSGGKSTVAALACAAGARFVVDDLLRLDSNMAGGWIGASAELRLRPRSDSALARFDPGWDPRPTVDNRIAVTPPRTPLSSGRLGSLAVLQLSSTAERVGVERLTPAEATIALSRFPRLAVWKSPSALESQFEAISGLAAVTPVVIATVPWRSPVDPGLGSALLEALREVSSLRTSVAS